jgi:membrane AbrB-like protein
MNNTPQMQLATINPLPAIKLAETEIKPKFSPSHGFKVISSYSLICLELLLGLLLGSFFMAINLGAGASILSGIAAGAMVSFVCRIVYKKTIKPHTNLRKIGQAIVGLAIGISIAHSNIVDIGSKLPILIVTSLLLLLSSFFIGYIYSRISKVELLSGLLAVTPGNIGVMASLAADYGKDVSLITLVQVMRFTAIMLLMPAITHVSLTHNQTTFMSAFSPDLFTFNPSYLLLLFIVLAITFAVARIGSELKVPAAYLLCSILVGIFLNYLLMNLPLIAQDNFTLPPVINLVGQTLLGITIGEYWGISPNIGKRQVIYAAIPVALTFLAALTLAGIATLLTNWDWLTCLLMVAPGGSPEMILISLVLNHNVETVTASHIIRLIAINLYLPILLWAWERYKINGAGSQVKTSPSIQA